MHVSTYVISKQLQFRISLISKLVKKKLIHRECAKKELNMGNNAEIDPTFKDSIPHPMRKHKTEVIVDPEWEEEVPTYDPTAVAKERPVLRLMQNMTRKERIEGRMAERERLRSLEESEENKRRPPEPVPKPEPEVRKTISLRRPGTQNIDNAGEKEEYKSRSEILQTLAKKATSSHQLTNGESAYDKYLSMKMGKGCLIDDE